MRTVLAKVRLATGNVGWYDPLTNIHLTIQSPEAFVYEGQNTSNLKKGVMYKTIAVIDGSLSEPSDIVTPTKINVITETVKTAKTPCEITEEVIKKEEPQEISEEVVEETVVKEVVEEKPKKKTRKKKSE